MLIKAVKKLEEYRKTKRISFEKYYRDRALMDGNNLPTKIDSELMFNEKGFVPISNVDISEMVQNKNSFREIFFDEEFSQLLWFLRCASVGNKSLLSIINTYIDQIQNVYRGGLNTYKRNGWDVHVLYVCQLVGYNFKNNAIPKAYKWNFDVTPMFNHFNKVYIALSKTAKFILNLGGFLHDIGVTKGVADHEFRGIPLTAEYYNELSLDEQFLSEKEIFCLEMKSFHY